MSVGHQDEPIVEVMGTVVPSSTTKGQVKVTILVHGTKEDRRHALDLALYARQMLHVSFHELEFDEDDDIDWDELDADD